MKTHVRIKLTALLLLSFGLFLFTSCSKKAKKEKPNTNSTVTATFTFENGNKVDYAGSVMTAVWSLEDGDNILSIIAVDKNYKNAILTFGISYADGPGSYSLDPTELMANPAKLLWDEMEYDNWMGFVTGDADGDGKNDGTGTFKINTLNEKQTQGTFSMVMGNDLGEKLTVEGKFNCKVMRSIEE